MTTPFSQSRFHQESIRQRKLQGFIGAKAADTPGFDLQRNYVNRDPQAKQVTTMQVTGTAATHTFTYDGTAHTVTTGGGSAAADAATIAAYMENEGSIYGDVDISVATDTITLTGKWPGFTFTLTESDANLGTPVAVTSAADAAVVAFGVAVAKVGYLGSGTLSVEDLMEAGRLADTNAFEAQLARWDFATMSSNSPGVAIEVVGSGVPAFEVSVAWNTNEDTTLDDLADAVNAKLVDVGLDSYVTSAGPSGDPGAGQFQVSAIIAGVEFKAAAFCDAPSVVITEDVATVAPSIETSLARAFAGMARRVYDAEATTNDPSSASYGANSQMLVQEKGDVVVENSDSPPYGDQVFVDLSPGEGKFYSVAGSNRVPLPREKAIWLKSGRSLDGETIGYLRLL